MSGFVRKHLSAVVLSTLALGGVAYVLWVDRAKVSTSEMESRKKNLFTAWRGDDLTRVALKTSSGTSVLERKKAGADGKPGPWGVTIDGRAFDVEDANVDRLLSTLEHASFTREIPASSVDRAAFGLDAPRATVDVAMGELSFHLAIGGAAPTKGEAYAEVKGRGVFAIPTGLVSALETDPSELRSKAFVPYATADVDEIDLAGEGGDRAFVRGGWTGGRGSGFRVKSPKGDGVRVDGDVLDRVLQAFGKMQAQSFVDDAAADKAATNRVVVTLVPRAGKPKGVLSIGGPCPTKKDQVLAIRREPSHLAVCVPSEVMAALTQPASAFEDRALVGAHADEVTEIRIVEKKDGHERKLEIARSGGGFKMRAPVDRAVSGDRGGAFLRTLLDARGDLLPTDAAPPEGTPVEVRILSQGGVSPTGGAGERDEELAIYPAKDDRAVVVRKEDGRSLSVPLSAARAFAVSDLLVRDLDVLTLKPADVEELSIEGAGKKQRLRHHGSALELLEPKGKGLTADPTLGMGLIEKLAALKTTRWVADADDGSFGFATPRFTVELGLAADAAGAKPPVKLLLGARTDDGSYGKVSTDPAVFLVSTELEQQLGTWLVNRSDFPTATVSFDKIRLQPADGKPLELTRAGNLWKTVGPQDRRAIDAAAEVQQALEELDALAAVSVGAEADYQGFKKPALVIECTGAKSKVTYRIGAGDTFEGTSIFYARRDDVDATYAVAQSTIRPLLHAVAESGGGP